MLQLRFGFEKQPKLGLELGLELGRRLMHMDLGIDMGLGARQARG